MTQATDIVLNGDAYMLAPGPRRTRLHPLAGRRPTRAAPAASPKPISSAAPAAPCNSRTTGAGPRSTSVPPSTARGCSRGRSSKRRCDARSRPGVRPRDGLSLGGDSRLRLLRRWGSTSTARRPFPAAPGPPRPRSTTAAAAMSSPASATTAATCCWGSARRRTSPTSSIPTPPRRPSSSPVSAARTSFRTRGSRSGTMRARRRIPNTMRMVNGSSIEQRFADSPIRRITTAQADVIDRHRAAVYGFRGRVGKVTAAEPSPPPEAAEVLTAGRATSARSSSTARRRLGRLPLHPRVRRQDLRLGRRKR